MSRKLEGKIAVVTGGTTGIGFAAAKRFADEGAQVVITGRRQSALDAAVARIGNAVGIRADSAISADLDVLFTQLKAQKGRIDVLFVNAGGGSIIRDCTLRGEWGEPDDVANLAVFLVSKRSKFITAQVIQCDGGTFDHNPARYGLRNLSIEGKALRPVDSE